MTGRFQGRVALVAGADGPMRVAIAARLSDEGATVVSSAPEGSVDILVWVAGYPESGPLVTVSEQDFKGLVQAELWAPYALTQAVLPAMREKGAGWILHIGDPRGAHPLSPGLDSDGSGHGPSSTVMAALSRLSTAMAAELLADGIAVNWLSATVVDPDPDELDALTDTAMRLCREPPARSTARVVYGSAPLAAQEPQSLRS